VKRDNDLIGLILLEVEKNDQPLRSMRIDAEGYSPEEISYHVMLLHQAGFVPANDMSSFQGMVWLPKSLTWSGHEFLDATRSSKVWSQVKAKLRITPWTRRW